MIAVARARPKERESGRATGAIADVDLLIDHGLDELTLKRVLPDVDAVGR
jgi:hypothetical protein